MLLFITLSSKINLPSNARYNLRKKFFSRFQLDDRQMPVLWHQALLTFSQRYSGEVSSEQKEALLQLLTYHKHPILTPEIRRELLHSRCRDEELVELNPASTVE